MIEPFRRLRSSYLRSRANKFGLAMGLVGFLLAEKSVGYILLMTLGMYAFGMLLGMRNPRQGASAAGSA